MKRIKQTLYMFIIGTCLASICLPSQVFAEQPPKTQSAISTQATNDFSTTVSAGTSKSMKTELPLASGETVSIKAYYSPESAAVDFGLISPDGIFHYISASNGNIDVKISIDDPGNYKFAIRNNSSQTISVSGKVEY